MRISIRARIRQRQLARQALNRTVQATAVDDSYTPSSYELKPHPRFLIDEWPAIKSARPTWWQCFRIEVHGGKHKAVLIYECRTEDIALRVANCQKYLTRVAKWGSRPYTNGKEPKAVS